jgi:hypothetical protein
MEPQEIVIEEAEVEVTRKVGNKDLLMGELLVICTKEVAQGIVILAQERNSQAVGINKIEESTTQ